VAVFWTILLFGGAAASCALLVVAGINRLRMIPKQARVSDRTVSLIVGLAVIAGAVYVAARAVLFLLHHPEWLGR